MLFTFKFFQQNNDKFLKRKFDENLEENTWYSGYKHVSTFRTSRLRLISEYSIEHPFAKKIFFSEFIYQNYPMIFTYLTVRWVKFIV